MYWLQAMTPLHVGIGRGVGFIDLPIMREKVTSWPMVPGSAVKGVMRDHFKNNKTNELLLNAAFGTGSKGEDTGNSGSLVLTDARIVCMPVRSIYGTFAYVTGPLALERLKRDLMEAGYKDNLNVPEPTEKEALHGPNSKLIGGSKIFFEDLDFDSKQDEKTKKWAEVLCKAVFRDDSQWKKIFEERFAVVSDNNFNFLCETATEVAARIKIEDDKKIVAKGALWYEEALPAETILGGIAWCDKVYGKGGVDENKIITTFCSDPKLMLQIGGKATVGKGRIRCLFTRG
jgi:CRISPR-associated protein Cmr4